MLFILPGAVQSLGLCSGTLQPLGQVGLCLPPIPKAPVEVLGLLGLLRKCPGFSGKRSGFLVSLSAPGTNS